MEWYPDNVYDKMEQNAETEFLCSREECATVAAKDPTVCYDKVSFVPHSKASNR
jgi:hypothetical protein